MKTRIFTTMVCMLAATAAISQANTELSNLVSPTKVNQSLLPKKDNKYDLGSTTRQWRDLYLNGDVFVDGSRYIRVNAINGNNFAGTLAGISIAGGLYNTGTGQNALYSTTTGNYNTSTGYYSLRTNSTGSANTAHGYYAGYANTTGGYNSAFGYVSLRSNTTGYYNAATGGFSLYTNTTGYGNSAHGYAALYLNKTGSYNTANGYYALYNNTTVSYNTGVGYYALYTNSTGTFNSALGSQALQSSTSGYNTAVGYQAALNQTSGSDNTAIGVQALRDNVSGFDNTAVGLFAGFSNTGFNNTCIGVTAGYDPSNYSTFLGRNARGASGITNSMALGYNAFVGASNSISVGNTSIVSIKGQVSFTTFSDGRFKKNIKDNVPGLEFIRQLKPITYTVDANGISNKFKTEAPQVAVPSDELNRSGNEDKAALDAKSKIVYTGFIAQDVEAAAKKLNYDFSGVDAPKNSKDMYGLRYSEFVVPLVKAVQELDKQNQALKDEVEELKKMITANAIGSINTFGDEAALNQNQPNPFEGKTIIPVRIPKNSSVANIVVTETSSGKIIKTIPVAKGASQVTFDAGLLPVNGTYTYSLMVDGKKIGSKQMILLKK